MSGVFAFTEIERVAPYVSALKVQVVDVGVANVQVTTAEAIVTLT